MKRIEKNEKTVQENWKTNIKKNENIEKMDQLDSLSN